MEEVAPRRQIGEAGHLSLIHIYAAAITVSRMGAMPSLPTVAEVQNLLCQRGYTGFDPAELDALK